MAKKKAVKKKVVAKKGSNRLATALETAVPKKRAKRKPPIPTVEITTKVEVPKVIAKALEDHGMLNLLYLMQQTSFYNHIHHGFSMGALLADRKDLEETDWMVLLTYLLNNKDKLRDEAWADMDRRMSEARDKPRGRR